MLVVFQKTCTWNWIEPLNTLYKDEVRALGTELGMPDHIVWRQPFPGPGLIRVMGGNHQENLKLSVSQTQSFVKKLPKLDLTRYLALFHCQHWRSFSRCYGRWPYRLHHAVQLSLLSMVWQLTSSKIPWEVLQKICVRIVKWGDHVNRIVYDITSKPPHRSGREFPKIENTAGAWTTVVLFL